MGVCGDANQPSRARKSPAKAPNRQSLTTRPTSPNASRSQVSNSGNKFCYFTYGFVPRFRNKLFKVNCVTDECTELTCQGLDFQNLLTLQVGQDLYGYQHMGGTSSRLVHITGLENPAQARATDKAAPTISREFPSPPVCYNNKTIFVTGGYDPANESGKYFITVDRYDISSDKWSAAPAMNAPRAMHHANVIGDWLYVFGGTKDANF